MSSQARKPSAHLPKGWPRYLKSSLLHVMAMAHQAIIQARGWAANSLNARVRLAAEIDQLRAEIALLQEELRIKDARMAEVLPHRRPHYAPLQRMAILELKAIRGWSLAQTAEAFLIEPATIAAWLKRLDETGPEALLQTAAPVNRFPDLVRYIVCRLKALCPTLGKVKIAQTLARAGLHLGATTVGRMLKAGPQPVPAADAPPPAAPVPERVVTAKYPDHVWHVDLTVVPTSGLWVTWLPFALPQCWPFCWWAAVVVDHFSRRAMGTAIFRKQPDGRQVRDFLARTIRRSKAKPKYIICDKGSQFWSKGFKRWCRRRKIKPRFGAVGQHGSIAIVERFIRTMKELMRGMTIPLRDHAMRRLISSLAEWYNLHRPHTALGGRTPDERYRRVASACRRPRFEPRQRWPLRSVCASPPAKIRGQPGARLELAVTWHAGRNPARTEVDSPADGRDAPAARASAWRRSSIRPAALALAHGHRIVFPDDLLSLPFPSRTLLQGATRCYTSGDGSQAKGLVMKWSDLACGATAIIAIQLVLGCTAKQPTVWPSPVLALDEITAHYNNNAGRIPRLWTRVNLWVSYKTGAATVFSYGSVSPLATPNAILLLAKRGSDDAGDRIDFLLYGHELTNTFRAGIESSSGLYYFWSPLLRPPQGWYGHLQCSDASVTSQIPVDPTQLVEILAITRLPPANASECPVVTMTLDEESNAYVIHYIGRQARTRQTRITREMYFHWKDASMGRPFRIRIFDANGLPRVTADLAGYREVADADGLAMIPTELQLRWPSIRGVQNECEMRLVLTDASIHHSFRDTVFSFWHNLPQNLQPQLLDQVCNASSPSE